MANPIHKSYIDMLFSENALKPFWMESIDELTYN
jgi:hypothetical protein